MVRPLRVFLMGLLCAISVAAATALQASEPPAAPRVLPDLRYTPAESDDLRCDVYLPVVEADVAVPVVLVIHGGAWRAGDKWTVAAYGSGLSARGIAAVVINYRLAPEHPFPAQIDDVRDALIWIAEHAEEYGWDETRLGIFGYSAGAHMACMIGTLSDESPATRLSTSNWSAEDPRWQAIPPVKAIAAGGAPCEFRNLPPSNTALAYFLGGSRAERPDAYRAASPAAFASAGDVPTLFIHGSNDLIVPYRSARTLFDKQQAEGVPSEFLTIEGQGHLMTFIHEKTFRAVNGFFRHHLFP